MLRTQLLADRSEVDVPIDGAQMIHWNPIVETTILEHRGSLYSTAHHRVASAPRSVAQLR